MVEGWSEVLAKQRRIITENLARRITVVWNEAEQLNNHKRHALRSCVMEI